MKNNKLSTKLNFFFLLDKKLELLLKKYIGNRGKQEISGGLIGDIKGGNQNQIIFDVKKFLPFPNLAENKRIYAEPPKMWFDILEEWRIFYYDSYKFIGFLHTHPEGSSMISEQDKKFATFLHKKYGSIIFIVISENKSLRSYMFNNNGYNIINGNATSYKIITR